MLSRYQGDRAFLEKALIRADLAKGIKDIAGWPIDRITRKRLKVAPKAVRRTSTVQVMSRAFNHRVEGCGLHVTESSF
jgi:hypothetical protein